MRKLSRDKLNQKTKLRPMQNVPAEFAIYPFVVNPFDENGKAKLPIQAWNSFGPACVAALAHMRTHAPEIAVVIDMRMGEVWQPDWIESHVDFAVGLMNATPSSDFITP